jgi:hypothetical protein
MLWVERIASCISAAVKDRGESLLVVAESAEVSADTVNAVMQGKGGTGLKNVDRVARAVGLQIVADCIPADGAKLREDWEKLLAQVREKGPRMEGDTRHAEVLLHWCDMLIKTGQAAGAVRVLQRWQGEGSSDYKINRNGGSTPLA